MCQNVSATEGLTLKIAFNGKVMPLFWKLNKGQTESNCIYSLSLCECLKPFETGLTPSQINEISEHI